MDVPFDDLWDSGGATLDKTLPVLLKGAPHGSYVMLAATSRACSNEKDGGGVGALLCVGGCSPLRVGVQSSAETVKWTSRYPPLSCAIAWHRCSFTITMLGFTPPVVGPAAGAAAGGKLWQARTCMQCVCVCLCWGGVGWDG